MTETLTSETSKLLSDVTGQARTPVETSEARLVRLAEDPLAVFAELHHQRDTPPQPQNFHPEVRARIAAAITPTTWRKRESHSGPTTVLHRLRATAPAIAAHTYKEERAAPFQPSAADIREAIDVGQLDHYFPALAFFAAVATAFLLWLLN